MEEKNAVEVLKKRYVGNDPEKKKLLEQARAALQARIDADLELEMIPIRKENEKATVHAFLFGIPLLGLLTVIKYGILPLILL